MIDTNQFFREATLRLCSELEVEKALLSCLAFIKDHLPADYLVLQIYEPALGSMRLVAIADHASARQINKLVPLPTEAKRRLGKEPDTKPFPVVVRHPAQEPIAVPNLKALGLDPLEVSLVTMPVLMGPDIKTGQKWGSVVVIANQPDAFSEQDVELLAVLAEPFGITMANTLHHQQVLNLTSLLNDENKFLRKELQGAEGQEIIGAEFGLSEVMHAARKVARHNSPVLLTGETGVGKDVIANHIHQLSPRNAGPMIKVNCGAIPETLIDSELFGHEKGAFTGALSLKRGRFERADGGTIFLDEVGELPPAAQVRLLRVLQNKEIERVGGTQSVHLDIRIVAATNRNLQEMVADGRFRQDLWFRLNVFPIHIPALRDRKQDIPALLEFAVNRKVKELKLGMPPRLARQSIDQLTSYHWPGNVRELENVVERALVIGGSDYLSFDHVMAAPLNSVASENPSETEPLGSLDEVAAAHIRRVLAKVDGKIHGKDGAAEILGINESTLRNRMNKLGVVRRKR